MAVDLETLKGNAFYGIALHGTTRDRAFIGGTLLDTDLCVLSRNPLRLPKDLAFYHGDGVRRAFERSNLVVVAGGRHGDLEPARGRVNALFLGVLLLGVPGWTRDGAFGFSASRQQSGIVVDSVSQLKDYRFQRGTPTFAITRKMFQDAFLLAQAIETLKSGPRFAENRLAKGFEAYERGLCEEYNEYRIYEFVRSMEAILKASKNDLFSDRMKQLVSGSGVRVAALKQMYDVRNEVTHLKAWGRALSGYKGRRRRSVVLQERCLQAEVLAAVLYRHVLARHDLRECFWTDDSVTAFWQGRKLTDDQRRKHTWGRAQLTSEDKRRLRWRPALQELDVEAP